MMIEMPQGANELFEDLAQFNESSSDPVSDTSPEPAFVAFWRAEAGDPPADREVEKLEGLGLETLRKIPRQLARIHDLAIDRQDREAAEWVFGRALRIEEWLTTMFPEYLAEVHFRRDADYRGEGGAPGSWN